MATTEERVRQLVDDNLEVDGRPIGRALDLDANITDAGVSSPDVVAFLKLVNEEFGLSISAGDCGDLLTPRSLIEFIDANAA